MREEVKIKLLQNILGEVTNKYDYFIANQKEILQETFEKAIKDPLTGLYNRNYLMEQLNLLFAKANREKNKIILIFIDLNNFKQVNDNYGHEEGDKVLKEVTNILKKEFRKYDLISRYGGDEFIVVLDSNNNVNIEKIMNRINEKVKQLLKEYNISVAYGYATSDEISDIEQLIYLADARMYHNKNEMKK